MSKFEALEGTRDGKYRALSVVRTPKEFSKSTSGPSAKEILRRQARQCEEELVLTSCFSVEAAFGT